MIIIIIIISITVIYPSKFIKFSAIQGLRKHVTCCLGVLSVIIRKNRFVLRIPRFVQNETENTPDMLP